MTVFAKIIRGELPADKVFENERILVIKDIAPKAPVHLLFIPKEEVKDLQSLQDFSLVSEMVEIAQNLAKEMQIDQGYRFVSNIGPDGGQEVPHLHFHLLGGRVLGSIA